MIEDVGSGRRDILFFVAAALCRRRRRVATRCVGRGTRPSGRNRLACVHARRKLVQQGSLRQWAG